jgi:hypothetical protein
MTILSQNLQLEPSCDYCRTKENKATMGFACIGQTPQHQAQCQVGSLIYFESRNKSKLQQDKKPHLLGKKTTTSRETQKHIRLYFFNLGKGIQSSEKGFL